MIAKQMIQRRGFTIVELLVSMALIILIMAVLSEAFVAGLSAFRSLKAIGDLQERMRLAATKLRQDLALRHFEGDRKLSDDDPSWQNPFVGDSDRFPGPVPPVGMAPNGQTRSLGGRPAQGFFRVQTPPLFGAFVPANSAGTSVNWEGSDDGVPSFLTSINSLPVLHFTSKLAPDRKDALRREHLYSTPIPASVAGNPPTATGYSLIDQVEGPPDFRQPGLLNSPWAEIAWFLVPTGEYAGSTRNTPLYSLYRRQRLLIAPRRDKFLVTEPALGGGRVLATDIGLYYGLSVEVDPSPVTPPNVPILLFNTEGGVAQQPYPGWPAFRSMSTYVDTAPLGSPDAPVWWSTPTRLGEIGSGESPTLLGDDLVVTDVISFEIKILRPFTTTTGMPDFRDVNDYFLDPKGDPIRAFPFGVYDTATSPQGWLSLRAIRITIRVWDFKTQLTRQVSIIQDL